MRMLHGGQSRASKAILLVHEAWGTWAVTSPPVPPVHASFSIYRPQQLVTESTPTQSDSGTNANADTVTDDSI